jgi:hypothetical protein
LAAGAGAFSLELLRQRYWRLDKTENLTQVNFMKKIT